MLFVSYHCTHVNVSVNMGRGDTVLADETAPRSVADIEHIKEQLRCAFGREFPSTRNGDEWVEEPPRVVILFWAVMG